MYEVTDYLYCTFHIEPRIHVADARPVIVLLRRDIQVRRGHRVRQAGPVVRLARVAAQEHGDVGETNFMARPVLRLRRAFPGGAGAGRGEGATYVYSSFFSNFWLIFGKFERPVLGCIEAKICK